MQANSIPQASTTQPPVVLYCRVSSDEQSQAGTIQNQIDFARRYCDLHGLDLAEIYADDGVSAKIAPEKRLGGKCLLDDARAGRIRRVLVFRLDRLSRNLRHLLDFYDKLAELGVDLASMTEPLDTSTPVGRFVFQLLGSIAELERETISERTNLGRERVLADGKALGHRPYGYTVDSQGRLAPDPVEAPVVQDIFARIVGGATAYAVAAMLNERGIPPTWTARGYRTRKERMGVWHHTAILQMVHNPIYWSGQWSYQRKSGALFSVPAPPLVEHATAVLAHQQLAQNNRQAKGEHREYLLSGLVRCGACGAAAVGTGGSGESRRYYKCRGTQRVAGRAVTCHMPSLRADLIDDQVWADIKTAADNPGELAEKIAARLSEGRGDVEALRRELRDVEEEYDALLEERYQAQRRRDRRELSDEDLGHYLKAGLPRVYALQGRKAELAERIGQAQAAEVRIITIESVCRNLRGLVAAAEHDPALKRKVVQALVHRATIQRHESGRALLDIVYRVDEPLPPDLRGTPAMSTCPYVWSTTLTELPYRACADCGGPVLSAWGTRCTACMRQHEQARRRTGDGWRMICVDCGGGIPEPGRNRARCPACRAERERLMGRLARRRQRAAQREKEV